MGVRALLLSKKASARAGGCLNAFETVPEVQLSVEDVVKSIFLPADKGPLKVGIKTVKRAMKDVLE